MPGHRSNVNKTATSQTGGPPRSHHRLRGGVPTTGQAAGPPVVLHHLPLAPTNSPGQAAGQAGSFPTEQEANHRPRQTMGSLGSQIRDTPTSTATPTTLDTGPEVATADQGLPHPTAPELKAGCPAAPTPAAQGLTWKSYNATMFSCFSS